MLVWLGLLWLLEAVDYATGHALDTFGVEPRRAGELIDVFPSAFTHFGFEHLAANSVPLFVLGFLAALRGGVLRFLGAALVIMATAGLGVWLIAPAGSNTAGASGVVFGLFGFLLIRGFLDREPLDIGIGVLVAAGYGSILWGVLPTAEGVSWQGHLFGLIGGVLAAFLYRERRAPAASRLTR
ncbi:rhomboid family intramembrane serine protease [Streptomyces sp. H27-D2]|uniref:rhomboid family intramembrane serine protease n=1 Tax=Streptomyces sp. H27-D2 TaxID=3046304 RepID=UPI002DBC1B74|nr:rhomboid family intramembrane serine protease [Streptomyces sp. H27-D2]MEC4017014.1 rhomboid family intramembrane serine protease [Streptomyces sp. H27-D2]